MKKFSLPKISISLLAVFTLIACTPIPGSGFEIHERTIFYVATTGNDSNLCTEPSAPCLTVNGAIAKADADDQINVAAGTYNEVPLPRTGTDSNVLKIDFSLWIRGEGPGETIIDAGGENGGIYIHDDAVVTLEGFTIQNANGIAPGHCIEIRDEAVVAIINAEVTRCYPGGISHSSNGLVTLTNVSVSQGIAGAPTGGYGISNLGRMIIEEGSIGGNASYGIISTGNLTLSGALIQNNNYDGLLVLRGEATLAGVAITNNGLDLGFRTGVAIRDGARVTISGSTISDNYAYGIWLQGATTELIMENTTVSDHALTGMIVDQGSATLTNVTLSGNGIDAGGASGIYGGMMNEGTTLIRNSLVTANLNGGVFNDETGHLTVVETTFDENRGALPAIVNLGNANIESTLISNNTLDAVSASPAALRNDGVMTLLNTTISGNSHDGIHAAFGDLSISYVTIADNGGNGITAQEGGDVIGLIANTLVVRNATDCSFGSDWPIPSMSGINIDTDSTCAFVGTYADADLDLDSLADNGGRTLTHALLPGSPALDAATGVCPGGDQRLFFRPFGAACDVGAFEAGGEALSLEIELPTPTADIPMLTVDQDFPCYTGPGPAYTTLSTLRSGEQLQIVGYGFGGGWLVAFHPNLPDRHCWIDEDFVSFAIPVAQLRLIAVPPKPTATPSPTPENRQQVNPTVCVTVPPNNYTVCQ